MKMKNVYGVTELAKPEDVKGGFFFFFLHKFNHYTPAPKYHAPAHEPKNNYGSGKKGKGY